MRGKNKCKILRDIRRRIATENDIPFITEECKYKGDCTGTCPKCESELRYLEQQLEKRRSLGKAVTVSAVALGLMVSAAGCQPTESGYLEPNPSQTQPAVPDGTGTYDVLDGELPAPDDTEPYSGLEGNIACPTDETDGTEAYTELAGAIAPPAENGGNG